MKDETTKAVFFEMLTTDKDFRKHMFEYASEMETLIENLKKAQDLTLTSKEVK